MSTKPQSLVEIVEQSIVDRTRRRVKNLSVELADGTVVIRGKTDSFHIKQLALHGAREVLPDGKVVVAIQVA